MGLPGTGRRWHGELLCSGAEFQFAMMKRVLEMTVHNNINALTVTDVNI